MCSWVNFYRRRSNEARECAARASNLSIKDKFEEVAKEWSALAVWAELKEKWSFGHDTGRSSRCKSHLGILERPNQSRQGKGLARRLS